MPIFGVSIAEFGRRFYQVLLFGRTKPRMNADNLKAGKGSRATTESSSLNDNSDDPLKCRMRLHCICFLIQEKLSSEI
jgi:hypothetical protein